MFLVFVLYGFGETVIPYGCALGMVNGLVVSHAVPFRIGLRTCRDGLVLRLSINSSFFGCQAPHSFQSFRGNFRKMFIAYCVLIVCPTMGIILAQCKNSGDD